MLNPRFAVQKEHLDTVFTALHGHKERANCVKWITARSTDAASPPTLELLSGSVDKSVILWQRTPEVRYGVCRYVARSCVLNLNSLNRLGPLLRFAWPRSFANMMPQ